MIQSRGTGFSEVPGSKRMNERERHSKGMKARKKVLGKAHGERAVARKNKFNAPFQDLITRYAWGETWPRPALPRKTRGMIPIPIMVPLNLPKQLKFHPPPPPTPTLSPKHI